MDLAQRNSSAVRIAQADRSKKPGSAVSDDGCYIPSSISAPTSGVPSVGFPGGQPSVVNRKFKSLVFSFPQRQYSAAARPGFKAAIFNLYKATLEQVALDTLNGLHRARTVNTELEAAGTSRKTFAGRLVTIEQQRTEAGVDPLSDVAGGPAHRGPAQSQTPTP